MRLPILAGLACAALLAADLAVAQAPAPAAPEADAPAAPAKPRAKRAAAPKPAAAVTVTNASTHTATRVVITGEDEKTATVSKPLAPKAKAVVKLPKLKGCTVAVQATFEGEGLVDIGEFDVCKDKTIRFTD
jgi:hypothetical protein